MTIMEDNTKYIANRIWRKVFPAALITNSWMFLMFQVAIFFMITRFCSKSELVIYSSFLPFAELQACVCFFFAYAGAQYFSICKGAGNSKLAQEVFSETLTGIILFGSL